MSSFSLDVFSVCVGLKKKQCCKCLSLIFDAIFSIKHTNKGESMKLLPRVVLRSWLPPFAFVGANFSLLLCIFHVPKKQSAFTSAMPPQSAEKVTAKAAASLAPAQTKAYRSLVWPRSARVSFNQAACPDTATPSPPRHTQPSAR